MKTLTTKLLFLIMIVVLSSCQNAREGKTRTFSLNYETHLTDIPPNSKQLRLWIPIPSENTFQEIDNLNIKSSPNINWTINTENRRNNKMIYIETSQVPQELTVNMSVTVKRWENTFPYSNQPKLKNETTLKGNRLVPVSTQSKRIARQHTDQQQTQKEKGHQLARHTLKHMAYDKSGQGWGHGDFQYACDIGKGNCTDFHAYFIGLCRSLKIPAYFEIGLSLNPQRGEGKTGKYHCWAYFSDDDNWIPVDISEADKDPQKADYFLSNHCENRVAFSIGRDIILNPPQEGPPLNYFIEPYAEIDGSAFKNITKISSYKDLAK